MTKGKPNPKKQASRKASMPVLSFSDEDIATYQANKARGLRWLKPIIESATVHAAKEATKNARGQKSEQVEVKYRKIKAAVQQHLKANKRNTVTHARKLAATELTQKFGPGYSYDTVLRATKNLDK